MSKNKPKRLTPSRIPSPREVHDFMDAAEHRDQDIILSFLKKYADSIDVEDKLGWTALIYASRAGHEDIVELLLDKGAFIEATDNQGWTALMYAARDGHRDTVALLLKNNASVNKRSDVGWTALMYAIQDGNVDIVDLLIKHGADIHVKDNNGKTAFTLADKCRFPHARTEIKQLLEIEKWRLDDEMIKREQNLAAARQKQLKDKKPPKITPK